MAERPTWGPRPGDYGNTPRRADAVRGVQASRRETSRAGEEFAVTGIMWDPSLVDVANMGGTGDVGRALARFRSRFPTMIWDAARLEGNAFTLPEVQALLEGVTVEGKRLDDQNQILALNEGFNEIDQLVGDGAFALTKAVSDRIHSLIAAHEAIESGSFRGEGFARRGGNVQLSDGRVIDGRPHGEGGETLRVAYQDLLDYLSTLQDPRHRALIYASSVIRHQLYFDGNKRTAKLMASGELMSNGFDAISIPYTRLHEQNLALDKLFATDDATDLMILLADSTR